jgi:hypothetical protein
VLSVQVDLPVLREVAQEAMSNPWHGGDAWRTAITTDYLAVAWPAAGVDDELMRHATFMYGLLAGLKKELQVTDEPRYSWIVRDSDDDPWILLDYRWTNRKHALEDERHWLHHHEQVKTVEIIGERWTVIGGDMHEHAPQQGEIR